MLVATQSVLETGMLPCYVTSARYGYWVPKLRVVVLGADVGGF
jgi:hypothetical protein